MIDIEKVQRDVAALVKIGIRAGQENDPRTQQSREGKIGPSDIGWCRQKAALMTKGVQASDSRDMWSAAVGTALHAYVGNALRGQYPTWLIEDGTGNTRVTATLPRTGAVLTGSFDWLVVTDECFIVLDLKTGNGLEQYLRNGSPLHHRYQRHIYGMGVLEQGIVDDSRPLLVGNVYVDRSAATPDPVVLVEEFNESLTDEIDSWVEDVIYAVRYNEDASRDIAAARCEAMCEFYTACRGALPSADSEPIIDTELVQAIDMYVEGRDMEKHGKRMKVEAAALLYGINGSDGRFQVRWTTTQGSDVPGYYRAPSTRIDVRKVRGAKK